MRAVSDRHVGRLARDAGAIVKARRGRRRWEAVVVGASAGGVEALGVLLPYLRRGFALPVIVVVHLRPDVPSLLTDVFGSRCGLPVVEAEDKMPLAGGHLYVAPPDYHLMIERAEGDPADIHFALSVEAPVRFSRPSIDVLFESAAFAWRERVLGILLSGANDDGARGLAAIRANGGTTWVQAPETAAVETMPAEAIVRGAADSVMTLDEIGRSLRRAFPS